MSAKVIDLGHGAGGLKMHELVRDLFGSSYAQHVADHPDDSAVIELDGARLAFTTDGFVVRPLFFPGGDVGRLAVCGTANDLAMAGATPRWLSVAMIIEEGFAESDLARVSDSIARTAEEAGMVVVTGDTKVVERGAADGIFITTSGIGVIPPGVDCRGDRAEPGMKVLVSGTIGDHEIAIMNARDEIAQAEGLVSDCAPLTSLVAAMLTACPRISCLRDPTRGGLATTLNEIAAQSRVGIEIDENSVPIRPAVAGLCDLLGLDPLYMANEGKLIAIVSDADVDRVLTAMRSHPLGAQAAIIGSVAPGAPDSVVLRSAVGGRRVLDMPSGRLIPRIC